VVGYTDSTGSEEHNQQLSELRANAVKNALVIKGVNAARLTTMGMGESNPIADNSTAAGRQLNRRVNIVISPIQQQGQPQPPGQPQPQGQPQGQYQPPAIYAPPPVAYAPAPVVYYPSPVVYGGYGLPYYGMGRMNLIYNNSRGYHGHRW
jgi:hypothetical protein